MTLRKTVFLIAACIWIGLAVVVQSRAAESCVKECTISYQACAKNHSQAACKNERDICIKHCAKN